MIDRREPAAGEPLVPLIRRPEACLGLVDGALVGIRRAMLTPADLACFRDAVVSACETRPAGLVMLTVFRLDPRFPLQVDFDTDLSAFVQTLRDVDGRLRAIASVLEFGGVRAAAMKMATRAVWATGRPRSRMAIFDRVTDASQWLAAQGGETGAPRSGATYLRAYRTVDGWLREMDHVA